MVILVAVCLACLVFFGVSGGALAGLICLWVWLWRQTSRERYFSPEDIRLLEGRDWED